jgi:hypothetical protein
MSPNPDADKLLKFLAIKKFEQPYPGFLDGVESEFHRRLAREVMYSQRTWQQKVSEAFSHLLESFQFQAAPRWVPVGVAAALALVVGWSVAPSGVSGLNFSDSSLAQAFRLNTETSPVVAQENLPAPMESRHLSQAAMMDEILFPTEFTAQRAAAIAPELAVEIVPISHDEAKIVF